MLIQRVCPLCCYRFDLNKNGWNERTWNTEVKPSAKVRHRIEVWTPRINFLVAVLEGSLLHQHNSKECVSGLNHPQVKLSYISTLIDLNLIKILNLGVRTSFPSNTQWNGYDIRDKLHEPDASHQKYWIDLNCLCPPRDCLTHLNTTCSTTMYNLLNCRQIND